MFVVLGNALFVIVAYLSFIGLSQRGSYDPAGLLIVMLLAAVVGVIATYRHRSFIAWFLVGCFITPLLSIIILFVKKKGPSPEEIKTISLEYIGEYEMAPEDNRTGYAKTLYDNIQQDKRFSANDLATARSILSRNNSAISDWK